MSAALEEATQNALSSMEKVEDKKEETVETTEPTTETTEESTEEVPENKQDDKTSATPEEIQEALNLHRALKDPNLAPMMIEYLAKGIGITKQDLTKATPKEQEKIADKIANILPPGFEYLEEALIPAIEKMVKKGIEEGTKDLRQTNEQANLRQLEKVVIDTTADFGKLHYDGKEVPANVITEVNRLSNIYTPQPGTDPKEHVLNLLNLAKARVDPNGTSSTKAAPKKTATPSVKNVLSSQKTAVLPDSGNNQPKLSLEESVQKALESMQIES